MAKKKKTVPFIRHYSGTYAYHARVRRRKILMRVTRAAAFVLVFLLGYFLMRMLLQISMLPPM
ncbi:MAG: hypothetical protein IJT44_02890 [Clostridia bacterium]|nr:hypothetical protein [Clostridia bacterium]